MENCAFKELLTKKTLNLKVMLFAFIQISEGLSIDDCLRAFLDRKVLYENQKVNE